MRLSYTKEEEHEQPDDKPAGFTSRSAVVGKGVEHPRGGYRSFGRRWGRIEFIAFYRSRVGFVLILPIRSLSGDGSGLAVGGFGRRRHSCESRRLLSGGSPHVVEFSEGLCFGGAGCSRFSLSSVLAVDTFDHKAESDLTIREPWPLRPIPCVHHRAHDKNLHVVGRAALLRRPRVQGRAAALPYQEDEDSCPAPSSSISSSRQSICAVIKKGQFISRDGSRDGSVPHNRIFSRRLFQETGQYFKRKRRETGHPGDGSVPHNRIFSFSSRVAQTVRPGAGASQA